MWLASGRRLNVRCSTLTHPTPWLTLGLLLDFLLFVWYKPLRVLYLCLGSAVYDTKDNAHHNHQEIRRGRGEEGKSASLTSPGHLF